MAKMRLLPEPKVVRAGAGAWRVPGEVFIVLPPGGKGVTPHLFAAERFEIEAETLTKSTFRIVVAAEGLDSRREIRVVTDEGVTHEQGYRLTISAEGVRIEGRTAAGIFYGFQTLTQIVREAAYRAGKARRAGGRGAARGGGAVVALPCVTIEDEPDFERRGFYHDTARGKVPTVDTLLQLIDDLGHLKYNEFQLYVENNFEFRRHPEMYDDTTPYTAEEMLLLDSACRARHIDFVPSLTSLGHFEKILCRPAFRHLAEAEPAELKKQGIATWSEEPWSLCVTDPGAKKLLAEMYGEFLPNFSSSTFNICCDESWDLGKGRSKAAAEALGEKGSTQLYVEWVNMCAGMAREQGKRIQMWGDIILHHPEFIEKLPGNATLLEWGYEAHHDFDGHCATIAERLQAGGGERRFYVAPGTASWLSFAGRSRNALGNIHNAAAAGLKHGAKGLLLTDWGDNGHQQLLSVSLVAAAYAAGAAWNLGAVANPAAKEAPDWSTGVAPRAGKAADRALGSFLEAASVHLFEDASATFAGVVYDLGLTYERFSWQRFNGSVDWFLFREKFDFANYVNRASEKDLRAVMAATEVLMGRIAEARLRHPEGETIKEELMLTGREIVHTCRRTLLRKAWLAADPAVRNPEHEELRAKAAAPLPRDFSREMKRLGKDAGELERDFTALWLRRNKASRLDDVLKEFARLRAEYRKFGG